MSDFWARRLNKSQSQQPPTAVSDTPASAPGNRPWWMPQQAAAPTPPQTPGTVVQHPPQGIVTEDGKAHFGDLLRQDGYTTTKAQSARDQERCPACDSPNYVADKSNSRSMKHCFDCGSNPRFEQTMAGISGTGQNIPVKTARVQNAPVPGAPPLGTVVGHV